MRHLEIQKISPDWRRVRCPYCSQTFRSFTREWEDNTPDFQCSVCQKTFWIQGQSTDSVIVGNVIDTPKHSPKPVGVRISKKVCPRCVEEVPITDQECPHCGVVFIKMIEDYTFQIRGAWNKVTKNWQNDNIHDEFLKLCHKQKELVYGIFCYNKVLKEDRSNKKAKEMIQRMEALNWFFKDETIPFKNRIEATHWYKKVKSVLESHAFDALMLTLFACFLLYIFA